MPAPTRRRPLLLPLLALLTPLISLFTPPTPAVLTIEVTHGLATRIPLAIVPFRWEGEAERPLLSPHHIITADLTHSGRFDLIPETDHFARPHDLPVQYANWQRIKADALVIGRVTHLGNQRYEVRFRLLDVLRERQIYGKKFSNVPRAQLRRVAHQISDTIHQKLLGKRGAFDTYIAYVAVHGTPPNHQYLLQISDADGHNPRTILRSPQPIISPTWSPDGRQLAYVSFQNNRSAIYIQDLKSGYQQPIAQHPGINSAPAWSPDGRQLALTLSKDGNAEIYIYHLKTRALRRLTTHTAVDTEPTWSPDGKTIAFTSNRAGTPQIYQIPAAANIATEPRRLTFNGKYNAAPKYSHDGKTIALITDQGNGHRVGIYSTQARAVRELTQTQHDESPTFAPNDEFILYATRTGTSGTLAAVSPDGEIHQTIQLKDRQVREPAWSPFRAK